MINDKIHTDQSVHLFARAIRREVPPLKVENFNTLSQFSHLLLQGSLSYLADMYKAINKVPFVSIRPGSFLIF